MVNAGRPFWWPRISQGIHTRVTPGFLLHVVFSLLRVDCLLIQLALYSILHVHASTARACRLFVDRVSGYPKTARGRRRAARGCSSAAAVAAVSASAAAAPCRREVYGFGSSRWDRSVETIYKRSLSHER